MTPRDPWETLPRSGLERLCAGLAGREEEVLDDSLLARVRRAAGLLTHPAAVTRDLTGAVAALGRAGAHLVALFGPEHGVRGDARDGQAVSSQIDPLSGLPVYSLYGGTIESNAPSAEMLVGMEVLLIDLQDVGARFYTYASTVSLCMQATAAAGVPVVVLDRSNPIGRAIEGPLLRAEFASFVGLHSLPIRHGCTLGELALLFHRRFGVGAEPQVVRFSEAPPAAHAPGLEYPTERESAARLTPFAWSWVPPSPNMPTPATALVYPGTCLLEGTNVSEGRGTAKPFEWIGAPWVDGPVLAARLGAAGLPGVRFRPITFIPAASKWAGEPCGGIQVHVTDDRRFRPVLTGAAILSSLRALWPDSFQWREAAGRFAVDRLAGTDRLRQAVDAGETPAAMAAEWAPDEAAFAETRESVRLYR